MGRKQQKLLRKLKQDLQDKHSFPDADEDEGTGSIHFTNKQLSKRNKKLRKSKKCSVTISKTYPWYIVSEIFFIIFILVYFSIFQRIILKHNKDINSAKILIDCYPQIIFDHTNIHGV